MILNFAKIRNLIVRLVVNDQYTFTTVSLSAQTEITAAESPHHRPLPQTTRRVHRKSCSNQRTPSFGPHNTTSNQSSALIQADPGYHKRYFVPSCLMG